MVGSLRIDARGGNRVLYLSPMVHCFITSGCDRYSSHNHAASGFFACCMTARESPAIVVAHPAGPAGSGAEAHFPSIFGKEEFISPANQLPAMYIATCPFANATRPS